MRYVLAIMLLFPTMAWADPLPVVDFLSITRNNSHSNDCAITFDDGPGDHTARMLDILAEQQIPATFFVLGTQIRRYPNLIKRMLAEGHEVENHSFSHPKMRSLSDAEQLDQMARTNALLREQGVDPHMFRPPYGNFDSRTQDLAASLGLRIVLWSHDSQDWRYHSLAALEGQVLPVKNRKSVRGIYLFHDTHSNTVAALPAILTELRAKGCRFVTVAQWVHDNPVLRMDQEQADTQLMGETRWSSLPDSSVQ